jgi:hypothetical protein
VGSARGVRLAVWPRYIHFAMVRGTRVGGLGVLCAALAVTSGSAGPAIANSSKVRLVVAPSTVLVDQRVDVRLSELRAKQRVRLSAANPRRHGEDVAFSTHVQGDSPWSRSHAQGYETVLVDAAAQGSRRRPARSSA